MKNLIRLLSCFLLSILANNLFSQTVIDYSAFSTTQCNAFYPSPPTINGSVHTTTCGTVKYDNVNHAIELDTRAEQNIYKGTEYKLAFNFKQGYSYSIKINAWCSTPTFPEPNSKMRVDFSSASNGGGSFCNGVESFNTTSSLTNNNNLQLNPGAYSDITFQYSSLPSAQGYLFIGSFLPYINGTATSYILIKKITITETPPAASFSISSSLSSITCGAITPITFTVNNGASTPGITGYTWNLGAIPNGWLYNGSPAPATILITSATLSPLNLTPDCGKILSNVSASVTANGNNYNTSNSAGVSITQPTYTITGNSSWCTGSTNYTLNGLVCNSSLAWTPPASSLGSLSSLTTSPTTLTYGGTSGNLTLTANVTSCGVTTPVTLPVHVGAYTSSDYVLSGNNESVYYCTNQTISFGVSGLSGVAGATGSNYSWTLPTGWTMVYNGGSNYVAIKSPSSTYPPTGTLSVSFTEPCGTTITKSRFLAYSSSACIGTDPRFTFLPNPAPSYIYASVASGYTGTVYIRRIQIVNVNSTLTVFDQTYPGNVSNAYITTSGFQTGSHLLRIYDGSVWAVYQFLR